MVQTKQLTVMFTDMKGFTARTSVGSRRQVEHLIDLHDRTIRPIFGHFGGRVIKTIGDAFLVTFESPTDAVLAGMKVQETVGNHNATAPSDDQFEVRVAINAGEVHLKEDDVFGEPVNITARIVAIAEPNEVYFTEAVYLTMNKNEIPSSEVGSRHLKGIPEQVKVYKVLQERTNLLRSRARRKQELTHESPAPVGSSMPVRPTTLPKRGTTLLTWILIGIGVLALVLGGIFVLTRSRSTDKRPVPSQIEDQIRDRLKERATP